MKNFFSECDQIRIFCKNLWWKFNFCAVRIVNDNRKFWKTVSLLLSQKACQKELIMIKNKVTDENISKNE